MDSGNSGSLQSSSGGDEEYDSILHSSGVNATLSTTLPPTTTHHQHHPPSSLYDTLSYYDAFPRSPPNPFLNLETPWSRSPHRPPLDPTCTNDIAGLFPTSSPITSSTNLSPAVNPFSLATATTKPSPAPPDPPPRNSKKRSRASRRAPTTVLTTDTSNFRAMVQEFTGIPAAPFAASSSSPFPRSRLDIFSGRSSTFHDSLLAPPPYLLRPFAQKVQATSFAPLTCSSSSTSLIDAIASSSSNATSTSSASAATLNASTNIARPSSTCTNPSQSNNYQLPHDLGLNMQNQMLNFQSLLQPPINTTTTTKYTLPNIPAFTDKSRSNDHPPHVMPDFGVGNLDNGDVNLAGNLSSLVGEGGDQPQLRHGSCKINF
ncbi:hypothetical protein J5N97_017037 [Dioscorea zingiberensis]|uniref:VQ domain-containing protein n=1 Tax=Dioscorea zingiberensis TaxID=325984 RepID=A0A9D5CME4_9LILI|nr:hypothetical protein J5N97_017037 [Dioscorea zingiberensis]